jgi:hypothetical protein
MDVGLNCRIASEKKAWGLLMVDLTQFYVGLVKLCGNW